MKTKLSILFLILLFALKGNLYAQVTIGSDIEPEEAALLDIKDQEADNENVTASKGGFLMPRVKLEKRTELLPFINGASEYDRRAHTGLIVYNLQQVTSEDLKIGLNYWDGEKWCPIVIEDVGKSEFSLVNCDMVDIEGEYKSGVPLTAGNVMKLTVNVTKAGKYNVIARAEPNNGYYFTASGEFLVEGIYEILAMGAGTPITPKENPLYDEIVIDLNGERASCTKQLEIIDTSIQPKFALNCSGVQVNGIYKQNVPLNASNTITLNVDVENGASGAPYRVYTDEIDGIRFEGNGVLSGAGTYEIILHGSGTPTNLTTKTFTIRTNSQTSTATCTATVQPVVAQKRIVAFGDPVYGFTSGGANGCGAMIQDLMNFGNNPNSIIKYEGFSNVTVETGLTNARVARYTGEDGVSHPYDIILITYDLTPNAVQRANLVNYVNKGGVLIYLDQVGDAPHGAVIQDIFGLSSAPSFARIGTNCNYLLKFSDIDDEILNGPFGDVRGLQWGEDYDNTQGLTSIPTGAIVYTSGVNAYTGQQGGGAAANVQATMMRHPTKNFFWCGDSGLIHGGTSTSNTNTPFWVGSVTRNGATYPKYPVAKPNYGNQTASGRMPVYNSVVFANVIAWALRAADENGINTPRP